MEPVNPIEIEQYLQSKHFPVPKAEIVKMAKDDHASSDMISVLERIPDREYKNASEAARASFDVQSERSTPMGADSCDD